MKHIAQSGCERQGRFFSNRSLMSTPSCDSLGFLHREGRENELRKLRLPRQRLRFVQSKSKQLFVRFARVAEFSQDGVLRLLDLRDELLARRQASFGERRIGSQILFDL